MQIQKWNDLLIPAIPKSCDLLWDFIPRIWDGKEKDRNYLIDLNESFRLMIWLATA